MVAGRFYLLLLLRKWGENYYIEVKMMIMMSQRNKKSAFWSHSDSYRLLNPILFHALVRPSYNSEFVLLLFISVLEEKSCSTQHIVKYKAFLRAVWKCFTCGIYKEIRAMKARVLSLCVSQKLISLNY